MHESTVSRITSNKYVATPHGIFELKFFFNSALELDDGSTVGSESVKAMVLLNGVTISVCLSALIALFYVLLPRVWPYLSTSHATWSQLWLLGSLGGILSLRYRPAYVVLALGAGVAVLWPLWWGFVVS